jgi:hypothetical protein
MGQSTHGTSGGDSGSLLSSWLSTHGIVTFRDLAAAIEVDWRGPPQGSGGCGEGGREKGWREWSELPSGTAERGWGSFRAADGDARERGEWREAAAVDALEWGVSEEVMIRLSAAAAAMQSREWTCRRITVRPVRLAGFTCVFVSG